MHRRWLSSFSVRAAGTPPGVTSSDSIQWKATRYWVQQAPQVRQGWDIAGRRQMAWRIETGSAFSGRVPVVRNRFFGPEPPATAALASARHRRQLRAQRLGEGARGGGGFAAALGQLEEGQVDLR